MPFSHANNHSNSLQILNSFQYELKVYVFLKLSNQTWVRLKDVFHPQENSPPAVSLWSQITSQSFETPWLPWKTKKKEIEKINETKK